MSACGHEWEAPRIPTPGQPVGIRREGFVVITPDRGADVTVDRHLLLERAREYELRAQAADDQALAGDHQQAHLALAWTTVAVVLREIADAAVEAERRAA